MQSQGHLLTNSSKLVLNTQLELTRRITAAEVKKINKALTKLTDVDNQIALLLNDIATTEWKKSQIINHVDMPYYALLAVQRGEQFTVSQFSTLMLYHSAVQYHGGNENIDIIPLFDNDSLSKESQEKLFHNKNSLKLSADELSSFIIEMKKLPKSEQLLFVLPYVEEENDILRTIVKTPIDEIFGSDENNICLFSLGMMQVLLNVKYKNNAVQINPVLGRSSVEDIRQNGLKLKRDMGIRFPQILIPKKADGLNAPAYKFSLHDGYHAWMASLMPPAHKKLMVEISDILNNFSKENRLVQDGMLNPSVSEKLSPKIINIINQYAENEDTIIARHTAFRLIDMEHVYYRDFPLDSSKKIDYRNIFWLTIIENFSQVPSFLSQNAQEELLYRVINHIEDQDKEFKNIPAENFQRIRKHLVELDKLASQTSNLFERVDQQNLIERTRKYIDIFVLNWKRVHILDIISDILKFNNEAMEKAWFDENIPQLICFANIFPLTILASKRENVNLLKACFTYIENNYLRIASTKDFIAFEENNPIIFMQLLAYLRIYGPLFGEIFKTVIATPNSNYMIATLIQKVNLNQLDFHGFTILDYAIESRNLKIIELLLIQNANPNPQEGSKAMPTLFSAIYHALPSAVDLLIKYGFDLSKTYNNQNWLEYISSNCKDKKTFSGIFGHYHSEKSATGTYCFAGKAEMTLFGKAKITNKEHKTQVNTPYINANLHALTNHEKALAVRAIDWGCQRVSYAHEDIQQKRCLPF